MKNMIVIYLLSLVISVIEILFIREQYDRNQINILIDHNNNDTKLFKQKSK